MSQESPLEFPCDFPIKALGQSSEDFPNVVTEIVRHHAPDLDASTVRIQESRHSRYQSVTITVRATSRGQLDAIYRELTAHERVMMALQISIVMHPQEVTPLSDSLLVRHLGQQDYLPVWEVMKAFTSSRDKTTPDELWLVEPPPSLLRA